MSELWPGLISGKEIRDKEIRDYSTQQKKVWMYNMAKNSKNMYC